MQILFQSRSCIGLHCIALRSWIVVKYSVINMKSETDLHYIVYYIVLHYITLSLPARPCWGMRGWSGWTRSVVWLSAAVTLERWTAGWEWLRRRRPRSDWIWHCDSAAPRPLVLLQLRPWWWSVWRRGWSWPKLAGAAEKGWSQLLAPSEEVAEITFKLRKNEQYNET